MASVRTYNLALIGFGNVGKEFLRLLLAKRESLRRDHGIDWKLTGIASRRVGWLANHDGLDAEAFSQEISPRSPPGPLRATSANGSPPLAPTPSSKRPRSIATPASRRSSI
jgi:homoserine dehydrogenase